jgi:starch phosphorylase
MAAAAGEANFFLFGLSAQEVAASRGAYDPQRYYDADIEIRGAIDLIASNHFSPTEPDIFAPIVDALLRGGDYYRHLGDLRSYADAQARLGNVYTRPDDWVRMAILNIAASGIFSSDRTIAEYARDIWRATPCPIE